ncbi:MAG: hypothetical protein ACI4NW_05780 [Stenotrophomonas sp.]
MKIKAPCPQAPCKRQAGIGLIQTMLVLLLVGGLAVFASRWLAAQQQATPVQRQQQSLRWADEAVAAFAARHSRLPCPAAEANGQEQCLADDKPRQQGWLPTASLRAAGSTLPAQTALAYVVQRSPGAGVDIADLTQLQQHYQPHGLLGQPRDNEPGDQDIPPVHFDAINGLDLCQAIASLQSRPFNPAMAHVGSGSGRSNVAYALAVAGGHGGSAGLPGDPLSAAGFPHPRQAAEDRVLARDFVSLAQAMGCRSTPGSNSVAPYSDALAGIDALAMAVALHDSALIVKDNNVGNAELQLNDAIAAEALAMTDILFTISELVGTTSSMILAASQLIEATATCIISLGTMCWRVPMQATAVAFEGLSAVAGGAALANQIAALGMASHALKQTVDAHNRAGRAAEEAPRDVDQAIAELTLQLHGGKQIAGCQVSATVDGNTGQVSLVYENDCDKNPDPDQVQIVQGLYEQHTVASADHRRLLQQATLHQQLRMAPFDDQRILYRIDQAKSMDASWVQPAAPYRRCNWVGNATSAYSDSSCSITSRDSEGKANGNYAWAFDRSRAIADAIAKRDAASRWVDAMLLHEQNVEQLNQQRKTNKQWFDKGGLLDLMRNDASDICKRANNPALDAGARDELRERCASSNDGVKLIQSCLLPQVNEVTGNLEYKEMEDEQAFCKLRMVKREQQLEEKVKQGQNIIHQQVQAYERQAAPVFQYPAGWFNTMVIQDETSKEFTLSTSSNRPYYAPEAFNCNPAFSRCKPPLMVSGKIQYDRIYGLLEPNTYGLLAARYPYHRGYMDWLNAQAAAEVAQETMDNIQAQIDSSEKMLAQLLEHKQRDPSSSGSQPLAIGTAAILEMADQRGSLGIAP